MLLVFAAHLVQSVPAWADDAAVKIGVLVDMTGMASDTSGEGSVAAVRMAVADFGGTLNGKRIEIVFADTLNKPDVASQTARRWFDQDGVSVIVGLPVSSVGLAVQEIGRERKKVILNTASATSDLTGKFCSPYTIAWADDTVALARGTTKAIVETGAKSWFFVVADFAFGHAMLRDATEVLRNSGGTVAGSVNHPIATNDFSSFLLQAQSSRAQVIALANFGTDTTASIKQAHEFGLVTHGQQLVNFSMFISDVHALGLEAAQRLILSEDFYWDDNEASRAWAQRFFAVRSVMPTRQQASEYAAVTHYLKAAASVKTEDAGAIVRSMKAMMAQHFGKDVVVRSDGRVMLDMNVYQVKTPAESARPWDYYKRIATVPAAIAFGSPGEARCNQY